MLMRKTGSRLLGGTALLSLLVAGALPQPALAQPVTAADCGTSGAGAPGDCARPDAGTVVSMPIGENAEMDNPPVASPQGFQILVDGESIAADPKVEDVIRKTDLALEAANVRVSFDGLGARPRLDLMRSEPKRGLESGEPVTFTSQLNYPGYVSRGEVRIIDRAAGGRQGRLLAVLPIDPNGEASIPALPAGGRLVAVHRVYDAQGRFDETVDLPLSLGDDRGLSRETEEGTDATARRAIPIRGGAVTISGDSVAPGGVVRTLGETVQPAPKGDFVLQRILPTGKHDIAVEIDGPQPLSFSREIEIPRHDMFYTALVEATLGVNHSDGDSDTYTRGRLAFYVNGYNDRGVEFTVAADSQDDEIGELFESLDEKDPSSLLRRIDPNEFYPVYGDGSTMIEDAPTQGKFYVRVERDRNYAIWGTSQAELKHTKFLRNERTLYGANGHWESQEQTSHGEPRAQATLYAARPDNLPQRDVLRGTGGSIYFLSRQDITRGSETVTVELRDPTTGRVIDRRRLSAGTDYEVNHLQGSIRLAVPLSSSVSRGVVDNPGRAAELNLVVQYEYTPVSGSVEGATLGGRVETWVSDQLRVGVTAQSEETGTADQQAYGADLHYRLGEQSFIEAEFARSKGPGYGFRDSTDGGLIYDSIDPLGGDGHAARIDAELDLAELGTGQQGSVTAYYEKRTEGFTSLDYSAASGETLWGFDADVKTSDRLGWGVYWDDYRNDLNQRDSKGGAEIFFTPDARNEWALGIEHVRRETTGETGNRTDLALRYTRHLSPRLSLSVLAQGTVSREGLSRNDRFGLGIERDFGNGWTLAGEVSDGTLGSGANILASYERADNSSLYFGYELEPDSFDIHRSSSPTLEDTRGRFVFGGRRQVNDAVSLYGENTYDIFGDRNALTSSYGVDYAPTQFLTWTVGLDVGQIEDDLSGNFKRHAISLGAKYQDDALTASGRVEFRRERGDDSETQRDRDADTLLLTGNATYKIDDSRTLLAYLDYADTDTDETSIRNGRLTDAVLGYALRPVTNDRLNMLFKYRYYYDMYGQTVDGTDNRGPRQKSHVFTVDAELDLNDYWSLGGKLGGRLSETADTTSGGFNDNNAFLAVMNARYHVVHNWDLLLEARALYLEQAKTTEYGLLAAGYRHFGNNMELGIGYNFGTFSDDLTDITRDDQGLFINAIAKF